MKYLCFDPGLKHTGVAISQEGQLVSPLTTIKADRLSQLTRSLLQLVKKHQPNLIIIGQPESGLLRRFSLSLKQQLRGHLSLPIHLYPEDLSSKIAQSKLVQSPAKKIHRRQLKHQAAAAIILQEFLENQT